MSCGSKGIRASLFVLFAVLRCSTAFSSENADSIEREYKTLEQKARDRQVAIQQGIDALRLEIKALRKDKGSSQAVKTKKKELGALKKESAQLKKKFHKDNKILTVLKVGGVTYVCSVAAYACFCAIVSISCYIVLAVMSLG